jgi:hypothetical protein
MTASKDQERRKYSRINFDATCQLHQGDNEWITKLLDISLKGILIDCPDQFDDADKNAPFEVTIQLPDSSEAIIMSLQFSHQDDHQMGFKCDYIDLDSITHLKRLVELNLGDTELLNRELAMLSHHD